MRQLACFAVLALLAGCRGEPVPRDYQNNPPAMTHPVTKSSDTPTAHGMPGPAPEPSTGAEGKNESRQPTSPVLATTDTQHATQTSGTAMTGTHLGARP